MIFPVARCALRWLERPGARTLSRAAMAVAFRGVRKILCVAEKNDAAKGIADLLSNGRMRRVRRRISDQLCGCGSRPHFSHSWVIAFASCLFPVIGMQKYS